MKGGIIFQLCFIPLLRLSCRKMGARPGLDFIRRKWLHVIINDDFLEGECYDRALLPSIICLGRLRIASKYIFNLWQLRQWVDSLAQWLEHWIFIREDPGSIPMKGGIIFQLCFIPLLRLSCRKKGISEPEFYGDLVYRFRKIVGKSNFSEQFRKLFNRYKRIGYSLDIMRQTACLVVNPIIVDGYASFFNCTTAVRASDSMTASS